MQKNLIKIKQNSKPMKTATKFVNFSQLKTHFNSVTEMYNYLTVDRTDFLPERKYCDAVWMG